MTEKNIQERFEALENELKTLKRQKRNSFSNLFFSPGRLTGILLGFIVCSTLILAQDAIWQSFTNGEILSESKLNQNFSALENISVPIGAIIPWYKDFEGISTTLPSGFVECDGNEITTDGSPYLGKNTPDLNGEKRFLRGGSIAGTPETTAIQGHGHGNHNHGANSYIKHAVDGLVGGAGFQIFSSARLPGDPEGFRLSDSHLRIIVLDNTIPLPTAQGAYGPVNLANETRPINMSVVWIMRVK